MNKSILLITVFTLITASGFVYADEAGSKEIVYKEYYENGSVSVEGIMKDGKKEGIFREYDSEGRGISERTYKNDVLDGVCRNYYETGELNSDWRFKNGKPVGVGKEFYKNGKVLRKWDHRKKDKGIILLKEFYKNSRTMSESIFKNNILVSIKRYDKSGKTILDENYERE